LQEEVNEISKYYRGLATGVKLMHQAVRNGSRAWDGDHWCNGGAGSGTCGLIPISLDVPQVQPHRRYDALYLEGGVVSWKKWSEAENDRGRVQAVLSRAGKFIEFALWPVIWQAVLYAIRPYIQESEPDPVKRAAIDIDTSFITMLARQVCEITIEEATRGIRPKEKYVSFYKHSEYLQQGARQFAVRALNYSHLITPVSLSPGYIQKLTLDVEGLEVRGHLVLNYEYDWKNGPFGQRYVFFPESPMSSTTVRKVAGLQKLSMFGKEMMFYTHLPAYPTQHFHIVEPSKYPLIVATEIHRCVRRMLPGRCQKHNKPVSVSLHRLAICSFPPPEQILVPAILTTYACIYGVRLPVGLPKDEFEEREGETMFDAYSRRALENVKASQKVVANIQAIYVKWFNSCNTRTDQADSRSLYSGYGSYEAEAKKARKEGRVPRISPVFRYPQSAGIKAHSVARDGIKNIIDMVSATCAAWDPSPDMLDSRGNRKSKILRFWIHTECGLGLTGERDSATLDDRSSNFMHMVGIANDYPIEIDDDLQDAQRLRAIEEAARRKKAHRSEMRRIANITKEVADKARAESVAAHKVLAARVAADKLSLDRILPDISQVRCCITELSTLSSDQNAGHNAKAVSGARDRIQKAIDDLNGLWLEVGGSITEQQLKQIPDERSAIECNCGRPAYLCDHRHVVSSCGVCYSCKLCSDELWDAVDAPIESLRIPDFDYGFGPILQGSSSSQSTVPQEPVTVKSVRAPPVMIRSDLPVNLHSKITVAAAPPVPVATPSEPEIIELPAPVVGFTMIKGSWADASDPEPLIVEPQSEANHPSAEPPSKGKRKKRVRGVASSDRVFTREETMEKLDSLHLKIVGGGNAYKAFTIFWKIYCSMEDRPPLDTWSIELKHVPKSFREEFEVVRVESSELEKHKKENKT
jgi:hypothetical protein